MNGLNMNNTFMISVFKKELPGLGPGTYNYKTHTRFNINNMI